MEAFFHLDNLMPWYTQVTGDAIDFLCIHPAQTFFRRSQVEKQLALRLGRGDFYDAPVTQDIFMNFRLDPVDGKRHQPYPEFRVEFFDSLHQAEITFLDEIRKRQSIALVTPCYAHDEAKVRKHQLACSLQIARLTKLMGELLFFFHTQNRDLVYRLNIGIQGPRK